MNKKLLVLALGAAMVAPMAAMADVKVYGRAHLSVDLLDDGKDYSEVNLSSNSSRLGFKSEKKFDDMTAFMQIEGEITYNQGSSLLSSRDTFVGLKGDFGSVRAGQFDTPFKAARGPANLFGDQLGDIRNLTRAGNGRFDERTPNTIHYQSPKIADAINVNLAYSLHEGNAATDSKEDQAVSASVTYRQGPVNVALAYESFDKDAGRGERDAFRLAGAYSVTKELKLVGFFQSVDHVNDAFDADVYGIGADYKVTPKTYVRGMYLTRDADAADAGSDMFVVGVEHRLDRAVRVYANYAMVSNDKNASITPWAEGRTTNASGTAGEDATGLSIGMRYDF